MQLVLVLPPWFCCFWAWSSIQLKPRCYLQGGKARGEEVTLEVRFLFSQFCPRPGTWTFCPGKLLGHWVQLSVSVSLFHSPKNFPSFSLSCLSLVPSQGTCLGFPVPLHTPSLHDALAHIGEATNVSLSHLCFSPSLSPSLPSL